MNIQLKRNIIAFVLLLTTLILACGSPQDKWQKFADKSTKYNIPPRWILTDPYTKKTHYWNYLWFHYLPPNDCRMALLMSPAADQNQFFIIIGKKEIIGEAISQNISRYSNDASIQSIKQYNFNTADGIDVFIFVAAKRHSGMQASETVFLLGYGEFGEKIFMINGGGSAPRFDIGLVENFIRTLVLEAP